MRGCNRRQVSLAIVVRPAGRAGQPACRRRAGRSCSEGSLGAQGNGGEAPMKIEVLLHAHGEGLGVGFSLAKFSLYKPNGIRPGDSYTCSKCLECVAACPNGSLKYKI